MGTCEEMSYLWKLNLEQVREKVQERVGGSQAWVRLGSSTSGQNTILSLELGVGKLDGKCWEKTYEGLSWSGFHPSTPRLPRGQE